jgi:hypothetical protein
MLRFRGVSIRVPIRISIRVALAMVGAATLLLAVGPRAEAQTRRLGVLRPAPRPHVGLSVGRPRWGAISPHFFTTCFFVPGFPFGFGGLPFVNIQIFAGDQPAPDPTSHPTPDPSTHSVPLPGSHHLPTMQPVPEPQPVPGAQPVSGGVTSSPHGALVFAAPVYSAPVYSAPVYAPPAPVATPQVSNGMVVGDVIIDPTFGLWGGSFFFGGGGIACVPTRFFDSSVFIR